MAIAWTFPIPITWTSDNPIWVKQWPLKRESLEQAHLLVQEQYQQGHLRLSTSPWNTPIFVIKKKSGKYRLLHDLREVNKQMEPMGALQPGMPNPAMLPYEWPILIVDLKDCFFTIPLHERDMRRFAFTLPTINREGPDQRFEWTVLPQGMRNSPTLCQIFVDAALQPLRQKWTNVIIYHYMDDILFAQKEPFTETQIKEIVNTLAEQRLVIAPEKIQKTAPWRYLGLSLMKQIVTPQKLTINPEISTLHDAQKLLGDLQWLKPIVGIPNELLQQLRPLLKGNDPAQVVSLSADQKRVLQQIMDRITSGQVRRRDAELPLDILVWMGSQHLLGAITQSKKKTGETWVLEWITPALQQSKSLLQRIEALANLVKKGRVRVIQISGREPQFIYCPMQKETMQWYLANSIALQETMLNGPMMLSTDQLSMEPLRWLGQLHWIEQPKRQQAPIPNAITVYTDAGKKSQTAAITWQEDNTWKHEILKATAQDTLQTLELLAVVWAMVKFNGPLNIVTDSMYVAGIVARIEDAEVREVQNKRLYELFLQLQRAIKIREQPYAVIHVRSHKWDIGLGEGNARADKLVSTVVHVPMPKDKLAKEAHDIFHQNAKGLKTQFGITMAEATAIVKTCPVCSFHNKGVGIGIGVNPRGTKSNEVWQMDVTHIQSFGRLKYVHVTIDTYSKYIWASAQSGEKAIQVIRHLTCCFAIMGVPNTIKTDNGPAYVGSRMQRFLNKWGVKHVTGIPHSPTGQAIVERANGTLKRYVTKYQEIQDVQERLAKTLFVMNHLCIFGDAEQPPAMLHYEKAKVSEGRKEIWVNYKDPKDGLWKGPAKVVIWGRGYLCVSTPTGTVWVPARWAKPAAPPNDAERETSSSTATD